MGRLKNLLVILKELDDSFVSLNRAVYLAEKSGAKLTILQSCYQAVHQHNEDLTETIKRQEELLGEKVNHLTDVDLSLDIIITGQKITYPEVHKLLTKHQFDFVFKSPDEEQNYTTLFCTPLDKQLIRDCKVPLWLVKEREWNETLEVLVSLDLDDLSDNNQALNHQLLQQGELVTKLIDGELHVIDCYFGEIGNMEIDYQEGDFVRHPSQKKQHKERLSQFLSEYNVDHKTVHLNKGMPDDEVPHKVNQLQAEIAVVGSHIDLSFFSRFFAGTAEQLAQNVPCDIIVLSS